MVSVALFVKHSATCEYEPTATSKQASHTREIANGPIEFRMSAIN